ncbi:MAG TPA: hypothetical protein VN426_15470 [Syntrophomonadaceae bacterium]|nr:hypothetical protein [Syntrophomonadaceae bacterium]
MIIPSLKVNEVTALMKLASKIMSATSYIAMESLNGLSIEDKDMQTIVKTTDRLRHSIQAIMNN